MRESLLLEVGLGFLFGLRVELNFCSNSVCFGSMVDGGKVIAGIDVGVTENYITDGVEIVN